MSLIDTSARLAQQRTHPCCFRRRKMPSPKLLFSPTARGQLESHGQAGSLVAPLTEAVCVGVGGVYAWVGAARIWAVDFDGLNIALRDLGGEAVAGASQA